MKNTAQVGFKNKYGEIINLAKNGKFMPVEQAEEVATWLHQNGYPNAVVLKEESR